MGIGDLSTASTASASDKLAAYIAADGAWEALTLTQVKTFMQNNLTFAGSYVTQYASPSVSGTSITVTGGTAGQSDTHLIATPVAGYAAMTIVLPTASGCLDGQKVLVNCTQSVTTLTLSANGATAVTGGPTTLAANAFFTMKFDKPSLTWYRVG